LTEPIFLLADCVDNDTGDRDVVICNSTNRREGCFRGKLAASRTGSTSVNVTVGKRSREYLIDREVERLIEAAKQNRSRHRDATAILVAYRDGHDTRAIQAYLGHRSIMSTVRYTALTPNRFKNFWKD
jgi:site-specific recombinase XerC